MPHAEYDGHMTTDDMEDPRFFLYGSARIVMESGNPWYGRMKRIGAVEVSRAEYDAADALRREGEAE